MAEPASKKAKIEAGAADVWTHACADVISLRLVEGSTELELQAEIKTGGIQFDAEFFHQLFGDDEVIQGYKELTINVWMSARTYHAWIDIQFKQKTRGADKLHKVFEEHFPAGFARSQVEFTAAVAGALAELADVCEQGETMESIPMEGTADVLIKRIKLVTAPPAVQALHSRFEPLLLFFIDGASAIEVDDKWEVLMALQPTKAKGALLMGLTTFYNFWAYPDASRVRLSQILVLPPYRDAGLGKSMLAAVYRVAQARQCVDLTLEDPTPNLQRVREKVEVEMLQGSGWVQCQVDACVKAVLEGSTTWPEVSVPDNESALPSCALSPSCIPQAPLVLLGGAACAAIASASPPSHAAIPSSNRAGQAPATQQGEQGKGTPATHVDAVSPSVLGACQPPASFLAQLTTHFKVYSKEARAVWESLLFLHPSNLWDHVSGRGQAALKALIRSRLAAAAFSQCAMDASTKIVVPIKGQRTDDDFIMFRGKPAAAVVTDTTTGDAVGALAPASDADVAQGRLTVTTMTATEAKEALAEMCEERMQQLKTLKSLMARMA